MQRNARLPIATLGFAATLLLSLGCTAPASPPVEDPGSGEVKPKVNRVVVAMPPPSNEGNNPNIELGPLTMFQLRPMLGWLIDYTVQGELAPMLATEWKIEPDGRSWRLKLRQGVKFHNNVGEFTAKDVVHSFSEMTRQDSTHAHSPIHRVVEVETINDYEVVFKHRRPNAEYLSQLSRAQGGVSMVSKADAEAIGANSGLRPAASTGPYQFKARDTGRNITFERVPYDHFTARTDFPELELRWLPEASTRLASLIAGEIHVTQLPQDLIPQAESRGFKLSKGPVSAQRTWLGFTGVYVKDPNDMSKGYVHSDGPFLDVRVRKAMNKAIDRDALNKAFFGGKAEPMFIDKSPKSASYFNPDWEKNFAREYGYDPAEARSLLQQAGYGPGKPVKVRMRLQNLSDFGGSQDVQEAVAEFWRKVGVEAELVTIQETEYRNVNNELGWKDVASINASSSFDIQAWRVYNSSVPPRGPLELVETDPLIQKLQQTLDEKEQAKLLRQIGDVSYPLHMNMPLFWLPAELVYNPNIVAGWAYPGSISRVFSHFENIKAAR